MKKIMTLILSICFMLSSFGVVVNASGEPAISVGALDGKKVTVTGAGFTGGEAYNLVVYKTSDGGLTQSNFETIIFTSKITAQGDGTFTKNFNIPNKVNNIDVLGGQYTCVIRKGTVIAETTFYYLTDSEVVRICGEFNDDQNYDNKDNDSNEDIAGELTSLIQTYQKSSQTPAFTFDVDETWTNSQSVHEVLFKNIKDTYANGFETLKQIEDVYRGAILLNSINTADATTLEALIEDDNNISFLGLEEKFDEDEFYIEKKTEILSLFVGLRDSLNNGLKFTTFEKIKDVYDEAYFVEQFVKEQNGNAIDSLILNNYEKIGISKNEYEKYTEPTPGASLIGKPATSYKDIKSHIENVLEVLEDQQKKDDNDNNKKPVVSKPTGGGGSSFIAAPPAVIKPAETTQNSGNTTPDVKVEFDDLQNVDWAKNAINKLSERGIVSGKGDGKFAPNDSVLREEIVKMVVAAFEMDTTDTNSDFSDVSSDKWFAPFVVAAKKAGIVHGQQNGEFGAGQNVTRQDVAVMIYRALTTAGITIPQNREYADFVDNSDISTYAVDAVKALYSANIINGMDGGRFAPNDACTRAQVSVMLCAVLDLI